MLIRRFVLGIQIDYLPGVSVVIEPRIRRYHGEPTLDVVKYLVIEHELGDGIQSQPHGDVPTGGPFGLENRKELRVDRGVRPACGIELVESRGHEEACGRSNGMRS